MCVIYFIKLFSYEFPFLSYIIAPRVTNISFNVQIICFCLHFHVFVSVLVLLFHWLVYGVHLFCVESFVCLYPVTLSLEVFSSIYSLVKAKWCFPAFICILLIFLVLNFFFFNLPYNAKWQ